MPAGSDFLAPDNDLTWGTGTVLIDGVGFVSVNEGSFEWTIDEPGGILAVTMDTGDDDNGALFLGRFEPGDGGPTWMEARFKYSNVDCAIYAGFTETLALDTPVMPAEFATSTMTYQGTGGMVGFNYDVDGSTDDFRALMGDGGAAAGGAGNGTRASAALTADRWFIARVVIEAGGQAECWFSDIGHVAASGYPRLRLIARFSTGTLITPTDQFYAVLMLENRSANARVLEVDYIYAEGGRDWRAD